jgi:hypothetical protein
MTNISGFGRPKNMWIRGSGSLTLLCIFLVEHTHSHRSCLSLSQILKYNTATTVVLSVIFLCECVGVRGQQREERGGGGDGEGGHPRPRRPAGQ